MTDDSSDAMKRALALRVGNRSGPGCWRLRDWQGHGLREGLQLAGRFACEDRLSQLFSQGWLVFCDLDGMYLRWPGGDLNQIFLCNWV